MLASASSTRSFVNGTINGSRVKLCNLRVAVNSCTASLDQAFVVDRNAGVGLPLELIIVWYPCSAHKNSAFGHCFMYDLTVNPKGKTDHLYSFKAVASNCLFVIPPGSTTLEFKGVEEKLKLCRDQDPLLETVSEIQLSELESD